jgi:hypothetical protein
MSKSRNPVMFKLIAVDIDGIQPDDKQKISEEFWRDIYEHEADRYFEASEWTERHIQQGYVVEYKEEVQ